MMALYLDVATNEQMIVRNNSENIRLPILVPDGIFSVTIIAENFRNRAIPIENFQLNFENTFRFSN